ncbi:unnamed protein product [Symbiodinium sp. KB8]|nr:unnamed protein product [Symbiodinium sp. KB8]
MPAPSAIQRADSRRVVKPLGHNKAQQVLKTMEATAPVAMRRKNPRIRPDRQERTPLGARKIGSTFASNSLQASGLEPAAVKLLRRGGPAQGLGVEYELREAGATQAAVKPAGKLVSPAVEVKDVRQGNGAGAAAAAGSASASAAASPGQGAVQQLQSESMEEEHVTVAAPRTTVECVSEDGMQKYESMTEPYWAIGVIGGLLVILVASFMVIVHRRSKRMAAAAAAGPPASVTGGAAALPSVVSSGFFASH